MDEIRDLENKSDQELVKLAQQEPDNFAFLINRYQQKLFWYIRHLSYFEKEDIEDMLQEVFVKVYRNLNEYDSTLKFSSWIYRITRNHLIDQIRKKKARPNTTSIEGGELLHFLKHSANVEKEVMDKDCLERVAEVIDRLPLKYKEILVLRFFEEKDYEEIMDIVKKPKGTVATLINRGRKLLVEELQKANLKCF